MKQAFTKTESFLSSMSDYCFFPYFGNRLIFDGNNRCPSCGYIQNKNPFPGDSVLIANSDDEVLLGKRKGEAGLWCLPCGYIETNENFLQVGHREVFEETGLKIEIKSIINVCNNIIKTDLETLVIVLKAEVFSGDMVPGDDIVELCRVNSNNIPRLAFQSDKYIINEYFKGNLKYLGIDEAFRKI